MNDNKNLTDTFHDDLDTNFELACNMSEKDFTHEELLNLLTYGNIPEKQIAALKFDYIHNTNDALALLNNLTGCDGKIREAVALKINTLINSSDEAKKLFSQISAEKFANATIDINANICRLIVDSAELLKNYECFSDLYTEIITKYTIEALDELDKFIFRDKKYVINKQLFKLYWCLEAISIFYENINYDTLKNIIERCASQKEYTIREKIAQIVLNSNNFKEIKDKLLNDENYYVRQVLHHPSIL